MKHLVCALLVLVSITGCGGSSNGSGNNTDTTEKINWDAARWDEATWGE